MATYVLVGGAWLGAWAWRDVARRLRANGHEVYPLSLTGLGDRVHLASPSVDLETHIADITSTLESEDLRDVILVGHSYASVPITGAADRAADRLGKVVYVDASPLPDGTALLDVYPPPVREMIERQVAERGDGWRWPLPTWDELEQGTGASLAGVDDDQRAYLRAHASAHPFGSVRQPLRLTRPAVAPLPKLAILCTFSSDMVRARIASGDPRGQLMAGPEWQFVDLPTGHWPMFSQPDDLAALLDEAGRR